MMPTFVGTVPVLAARPQLLCCPVALPLVTFHAQLPPGLLGHLRAPYLNIADADIVGNQQAYPPAPERAEARFR